jgi:hypothetical protein
MAVKPSAASSRKPQIETIHAQEVTGTLNGNLTNLRAEYILLQGLLQQLPANKKWTQEKRDRWLQAFTASIDLLVDIVPES